MPSAPCSFTLTEVRRLMKAATQVTGLPPERLRIRYSRRGGVIIEPIAAGDANNGADGNALDTWMKAHAGQVARD
jgi:hypothetical protein